jgi:maleate isomerase
VSARIGLIIPSSNPTIEGFLRRSRVADLLDLDVLCTRIGVRRIAADTAADAQFDAAGLQTAAELLADAEVELISWAGTSGFWLGAERETAALAQVSDAVAIPVLSSRLAMFAALDESGPEPTGVLTPYLDPIHQRVVAAIEAAGHPVVADRALHIERNLDFAAIAAAQIVDEIRRLAASGAGKVAVVCTNVLATLPILAADEVTVIDSVLATLWQAASRVGRSTDTYAQTYRTLLAEPAATDQGALR